MGAQVAGEVDAVDPGVRPAGTPLDSEELPDGLRPAGAAVARRVRYQGVGYDGAGRVVSGSVFAPAGGGPWPVVAFAHGTTGLCDAAAPSRTGLTRRERGLVEGWLAAGYAVAATDYEGLSTPGPHPYLNGEAVADDVVDAVRAAHGLGLPLRDQWLAVGFSQGGHAALFAGLVATRYAPELDFRGTIALAPPVHVPQIVARQTARDDDPVTVLVPFLLAGLRVSHPGFDARRLLTERGAELVALAERGSLFEVYRATSALTNRDLGTTGLLGRPGVAEVLEACRVPVARLDRPVLLVAGGADEVVPLDVVRSYAGELHAAGADVALVAHEGADHAGLLSADVPALTRWADRALDTAPAAPRTAGFGLLDATGDGYLSLDDYEVFALRLVQAFGEPPGSPRARAVREGYRALWWAVADRADTDRDGRVGGAEFLGRLGVAEHEVLPLAEAVLALLDADRDGRVDDTEVRRLLRGCEVPEAEAARVVAALDTGGDGRLSVAELVDAVRGFCRAPDAGHPGHWLFGRFRP
ncbi:lipase family protein [Actinosynnema sp. NPDC050436]|uniref:lipase family protein n=1 Tax=Actinosynnema sp. NPDC050436 TaxID=3155659 RepID=UPI0033D174D4